MKKPQNKTYLLIILSSLLISIILLTHCNPNEKKLPQTKQKENYNIKYFKKRRWCPPSKNFRYLKPISNKQEKTMKNYYKVFYNENNLVAKEEVYKNHKTPFGSWFYYDNNSRLTKEVVYSMGKKTEEFIYKFDKFGNKKEDAHYIWSPNKQLRVKSLYFYNKNKLLGKNILGKIQHFNTGILDEYIQFEYDNNANLRKKSVFFYSSQLKSYALYSYNSNMRLQKEEIYNRKDKLIQVIDYKYTFHPKDNNKIKLKEKHTYRLKKNKLKVISKVYYLYNRFGNKIKQIEKTLNNKNQMKKVYEFHYFYDKNNCARQEKRYDAKGSLIEVVNN